MILEELKQLAQMQLKSFISQLEAQNHKASGKLIESLRYEVSKNLNAPITIKFFAEKYGIFVDKGVSAENVKYSPYILLDWAADIKPSLSEKKRLSFVFAVRATHEKTGIPSPNSFSFSKNGERLDWINKGIRKENDKEITLILSRFIDRIIQKSFQSL